MVHYNSVTTFNPLTAVVDVVDQQRPSPVARVRQDPRHLAAGPPPVAEVQRQPRHDAVVEVGG